MIDLPALLPQPVAGALPGVAIGSHWQPGGGELLRPRSPIDGTVTCQVAMASATDLERAVAKAYEAFTAWRSVPAPKRGELVSRLGQLVRQHKPELAELITLEAGKIPAEALGEVQEWIDMCDFAVGLSRQLYGRTIATERPEHYLLEQWHPLGVVGVISAFNFPAAVWAWNAMLALVCGDTVVWKPSEQTPLVSLACHQIVVRALQDFPNFPPGIVAITIGGLDVGQALASHRQVPLVSATGSTAMGRSVAQTVAARLGRSLLELGGNNAMIVTPSADLQLAVRAILFAAVGTCGQRCTTLRRLIVHEDLVDQLLAKLQTAYASLPIGDPRTPGVLVGPLVNPSAAERFTAALALAQADGGVVVGGGERLTAGVPDGAYVRPAIVRMPAQTNVVQEETFAPILYVLTYREMAEAVELHNGVPQGLSSAIFTSDLREAGQFIGPAGSDCGIANVNIGTSGAEIGGAFGGEKDTGGGRESGSDSWKQYMRRSTTTINYGTDLPLAQGIRFG